MVGRSGTYSGISDLQVYARGLGSSQVSFASHFLTQRTAVETLNNIAAALVHVASKHSSVSRSLAVRRTFQIVVNVVVNVVQQVFFTVAHVSGPSRSRPLIFGSIRPCCGS